VTNTQY